MYKLHQKVYVNYRNCIKTGIIMTFSLLVKYSVLKKI